MMSPVGSEPRHFKHLRALLRPSSLSNRPTRADMTETTNRRVVIFFTDDGVYHVLMDPGVEVLIGHEDTCDHVLYKDRPIPEDFLNGAIFHPPWEGDGPDPINEIVLLGAGDWWSSDDR
jgi:hypothetical protein